MMGYEDLVLPYTQCSAREERLSPPLWDHRWDGPLEFSAWDGFSLFLSVTQLLWRQLWPSFILSIHLPFLLSPFPWVSVQFPPVLNVVVQAHCQHDWIENHWEVHLWACLWRSLTEIELMEVGRRHIGNVGSTSPLSRSQPKFKRKKQKWRASQASVFLSLCFLTRCCARTATETKLGPHIILTFLTPFHAFFFSPDNFLCLPKELFLVTHCLLSTFRNQHGSPSRSNCMLQEFHSWVYMPKG